MIQSEADILKRRLQQVVDFMHAARWDDAGMLLAELERRYPTNAYVLFNAGILHWEQRRYSQAIQCYRRCLGADPRFLPAMTNLAHSLHVVGDHREALRYAQMAVHRQPGNAALLTNLSLILSVLGEQKDAVDALRDALRNQPDYVQARSQLISALDELGRWDEALAEAEPLADHPDIGIRIGALFAICGIARRCSRWDLTDRYVPKMLKYVADPSAPTLNPMAFSFFTDDPVLMQRMHSRSTPPQPSTARRKPVRRDGKLCIGYMSPDFRDHPVAHMLLEVLRAHNRSRFRIIAVSIVPADGSPEGIAIREAVDEYIDLSHLDDTAAANTMQQAGIDVLVDIAGTTKWSRSTLLARRPCPVQLLWLGCPCSTGAHYYDAFVLDNVVAPPGYEAFCTEPIERLPCCYHPITEGINPHIRQLKRRDLGLPDGVTIVAMLQQPAKIRPPLVDEVARIVARHPDAHFWLRVHQDRTESVYQRLADIGLPRERVHLVQRFVNRGDYLAAHTLADIVVDSYPYGGHSTTGEALLQGVPVLTFLGNCIHTRVAASMLTELGLADLVQTDMSSMLETLQRFCGDASMRADWHTRFSEAAKARRVDASMQLTRALENLYTSHAERAARGD